MDFNKFVGIRMAGSGFEELVWGIDFNNFARMRTTGCGFQEFVSDLAGSGFQEFARGIGVFNFVRMRMIGSGFQEFAEFQGWRGVRHSRSGNHTRGVRSFANEADQGGCGIPRWEGGAKFT